MVEFFPCISAIIRSGLGKSLEILFGKESRLCIRVDGSFLGGEGLLVVD
jgi:hypothetical protein